MDLSYKVQLLGNESRLCGGIEVVCGASSFEPDYGSLANVMIPEDRQIVMFVTNSLEFLGIHMNYWEFKRVPRNSLTSWIYSKFIGIHGNPK